MRRHPSLPRSSARTVANVPRQLLDRRHLLGGRALRQREQDVGDVVLGVDAGLAGLPLESLLELARRHVDAREDVPLAQQREHDLAPHLVAVGRVVDALLL
jgi:hypothetical protein